MENSRTILYILKIGQICIQIQPNPDKRNGLPFPFTQYKLKFTCISRHETGESYVWQTKLNSLTKTRIKIIIHWRISEHLIQ